eukprot:2173370-Alexandrium_andersonii.AAC.1
MGGGAGRPTISERPKSLRPDALESDRGCFPLPRLELSSCSVGNSVRAGSHVPHSGLGARLGPRLRPVAAVGAA